MDNSAGESGPHSGQGPAGAKVPAQTLQGKASSQLADGAFLSFGAQEGSSRGVPPRWERLLGYSSQAALAVCLFGFAWAAGSYFSGGRSPLQVLQGLLPARAASPQEIAERTELTRTVQKIAGDIRGLQASVEALRATQSQAAKGISALEGLAGRLDSVKFETGTAIAALSGKVDRIQKEPEAKLSQVIDRLDRMERQLAAPATATATQKQPQISTAMAKPAEDMEAPRKPRLITNWVVRDVYDGTALIESPRGAIEVTPGEMIPGAGRVKSIEKRGSGWVVITSEGVVDSARDRFEP